MLSTPVLKLKYQQDLPIGMAQAWDFFSRPENLARITPPNLGFEITSDVPAEMYAGMIIQYRVCPFAGFAVPWITEITQVQKPSYFIDEQRSGPYRFWHHQHVFAEIDGGVRMTDLIHYQIGFGWFGYWLTQASVRRRLADIFSYRRKTLIDLFGTIGQ